MAQFNRAAAASALLKKPERRQKFLNRLDDSLSMNLMHKLIAIQLEEGVASDKYVDLGISIVANRIGEIPKASLEDPRMDALSGLKVFVDAKRVRSRGKALKKAVKAVLAFEAEVLGIPIIKPDDAMKCSCCLRKANMESQCSHLKVSSDCLETWLNSPICPTCSERLYFGFIQEEIEPTVAEEIRKIPAKLICLPIDSLRIPDQLQKGIEELAELLALKEAADFDPKGEDAFSALKIFIDGSELDERLLQIQVLVKSVTAFMRSVSEINK